MCGRFSQTLSFQILHDYFHLDESFAPPPRYSLALLQAIAAVHQEDDRRRLVALHWGLMPFWAKDRKIGYKFLITRSRSAPKRVLGGRAPTVPVTVSQGFDEKGLWNLNGLFGQPHCGDAILLAA